MYASHTYTFELNADVNINQILDLWGERVVSISRDTRQLVVCTPSLRDSLFWSLYGMTKPYASGAAYSGRHYSDMN